MNTLSFHFSHNEFSDDLINSSIFEIINSNNLLSMASINNNKSWINTAFYCFNNFLEIFFLTEIESQHSLNVAENDSVAVSIFDTNQNWGPGKLKGLQVFGICKKAHGIQLLEGIRLYVKRYPNAAKWLLKPDDLLNGLLGSWVYVVVPCKVKILHEELFGEENYLSLTIDRNK